MRERVRMRFTQFLKYALFFACRHASLLASPWQKGCEAVAALCYTAA